MSLLFFWLILWLLPAYLSLFFDLHIPSFGFLSLDFLICFPLLTFYLLPFLSVSVPSQCQSGEEQAGSGEFGHNSSGPVPVGVFPWSGMCIRVCAQRWTSTPETQTQTGWHIPSTSHSIHSTVKTHTHNSRTYCTGDINVCFTKHMCSAVLANQRFLCQKHSCGVSCEMYACVHPSYDVVCWEA